MQPSNDGLEGDQSLQPNDTVGSVQPDGNNLEGNKSLEPNITVGSGQPDSDEKQGTDSLQPDNTLGSVQLDNTVGSVQPDGDDTKGGDSLQPNDDDLKGSESIQPDDTVGSVQPDGSNMNGSDSVQPDNTVGSVKPDGDEMKGSDSLQADGDDMKGSKSLEPDTTGGSPQPDGTLADASTDIPENKKADGLDTNKENLANELAKANEQVERLKAQLLCGGDGSTSVEPNRNDAIIDHLYYGGVEITRSRPQVVAKIAEYANNGKEFVITNELMGGDTRPGVIKRFYTVYRYGSEGLIQALQGLEGETSRFSPEEA